MRDQLPFPLRMLGRREGRPALRQLAVASALATALMVGLRVWATSFFVRVQGMSLPIAALLFDRARRRIETGGA